MPRYRKLSTGIRSPNDLVRALGELGLKNVELHEQPRPLDDWIGRPTDVRANVIVRRKDLGASSDDMGFALGNDSTFDLLVSEIHLFRFDKKWLADLATRTGTMPSAAGPITFAAGSAAMPGVPPPPVPAREQNSQQLARIETHQVLEQAKKGQSLGGIGCLLYFVPVLPWLLFAKAMPDVVDLRHLIALMAVWTVGYFIVISLVVASRMRTVLIDFSRRFPTPEARKAALAEMKIVANDHKHAATETAKRLLRQLERDATPRTVTPRPPTSPRGPGARGS